MKTKLLSIVAALFVALSMMFFEPSQALAETHTINGAGATFPYPIYSQWAYKYNKLTGVRLNYQSIGSGGGIAQIKAKTVDFGASDAPLTKDKLDEAGLIQFPMIVGGVVPVINVPGVKAGELRLSSDALADIFLGKIKKWNDKKIAELNPSAKLPDLAVTVVHRADGSGTTWIFTNYLTKISAEWKEKIGMGKAVSWPTGMGGKGNEGVSAFVQRTKGAIGYVEFAYALQNKMSHVLLKNQAGSFVAPTIDTFMAAAANANWEKAEGFYLVLTNQPGDASWPITGASFILVHKNQADPENIKQVFKYFDWCYRHGSDLAKNLHYIPIPLNVVELVQKKWNSDVQFQGKPIDWK